MSSDKRYKMSISLNVLRHLGISLYSTIPAVLSEIVANSWDADASKVKICIQNDRKKITVFDNGHGMNEDDINGKYLNVGYSKRANEPSETERFQRSPMGRKGIGKLSVFAIANVVEVYTARKGEKHALRMDAKEIETLISRDEFGDIYTPQELDVSSIDFEDGTRIVLKELKIKSTAATFKNLRQRVARRFSIIGESDDFSVEINDKPITPADRGYYKDVQFLWYFGEESKRYADLVGTDVVSEMLSNIVEFDSPVELPERQQIRGWIGTVELPSQLNDETNGIVVFAKGKLIEENLLPEMDDSRLFTEYIVGEIDADFMDLDELDDIVTSNRQSVKRDDPRYESLSRIVKHSLNVIGNQWTELRNRTSLSEATKDKSVAEWYNSLKVGQQKYARKLFGKIENLGLPDNKSRQQVYKANIIAFQRLSLTYQLDLIDKINTQQDMNTLMELFGRIDELEIYHYYEIVKGRLEVLRSFHNLVGENAKEKVLQNYLFDHLWLLDSSWERAAVKPLKEQSVRTECKELDKILSDKHEAGRIDIRYQTLGGKHVIIELKRYRRQVQLMELTAQVTKYYNALEKCLRARYPNSFSRTLIEVICIIGKPPTGGRDADHVANLLATSNARFITYEELIEQAQLRYTEYFEAEREIGKLSKLLDGINFEYADEIFE